MSKHYFDDAIAHLEHAENDLLKIALRSDIPPLEKGDSLQSIIQSVRDTIDKLEAARTFLPN